MPFRRAEIDKICQLVDDSKRKYPTSFEEKQRIIAHVGKIVAANNLIQASRAKKLSDDSVTILIVILMRK